MRSWMWRLGSQEPGVRRKLPTPHTVRVPSRFSRVGLVAAAWTVAPQTPLSMGFSRQGCWSGKPFSTPGNLPDPGIEPTSLPSPSLAGGLLTARATWLVNT